MNVRIPLVKVSALSEIVLGAKHGASNGDQPIAAVSSTAASLPKRRSIHLQPVDTALH